MVGDLRAVCSVPNHSPPDINATRDALFLDIDGTLIDIASTPTDVHVPSSLIGLLKQLQARFGGALAVVTGRQIEDVDRLFNPLRLAASGVHGCEIRYRPDAAVERQSSTISADHIAAISVIAARYPGVMIEPKGTGVAVHFRNVPHNGAELQHDLQSYFSNQSAQLVVAHGRMVFEILPTGFSKATAVASLWQRAPFAGRRPVMIGDDVGDIPAFDFAQRAGGVALRVAGEHFGFEKAELSGPSAVRDFLGQLIDSPSVREVHQ